MKIEKGTNNSPALHRKAKMNALDEMMKTLDHAQHGSHVRPAKPLVQHEKLGDAEESQAHEAGEPAEVETEEHLEVKAPHHSPKAKLHGRAEPTDVAGEEESASDMDHGAPHDHVSVDHELKKFIVKPKKHKFPY